MLLSAHAATRDGSKFILEEYAFGTYCLWFENLEDEISARDDLCDSLQDAKEMCAEDHGVPLEAWLSLENHDPIMVPD